MKFHAERTRLLDALSLAASVIPSRSVKPVLQNLRLVADAEAQSLTVQATDLDVALNLVLPEVKVETEGEVLLPGSRLVGVLREALADEVRVDRREQGMVVRCGRGQFRIQPDGGEGFPDLTEAFEGITLDLEVPVRSLRALIKKTMFAAAKEKTRFAFNGVRFECDGTHLRAIATDGKRMAIKSLSLGESGGDSEADEAPIAVGAGILPMKGLQLFDRVLGDATDIAGARFTLSAKEARIRVGSVEARTRLLEGSFPRYQSVLPKTRIATMEFDKQELLASLRQANVLTSEETRSVRFSFGEEGVDLASRAAEVGEAEVHLPGTFEGDAIDVNYNPDFLIEGLRIIDAERVTLELSGQDTPSQILGEEAFIYVVMPVTMRSG